MTDVGKIKLSVQIDADNLSEKLGEAVRKAIAPALAEIQRELNKVQHEYDQTAKAAEKSSAAQVAGAKAVQDALNGVERKQIENAAVTDAATAATRRQKDSADGLTTSTNKVAAAQRELNTAVDIFGRKSPQAEAAQKRLNSAQEAHTTALIKAAAESRASTDSQVHDYERLARAAEESAAKQAAVNRAAAASRSGGGRSGGVLGFLTGPVGLNAIALGAEALPAALTGVTALVGAVQQLGQAGLALPAIYGAVGASIGVALLGVHGMKDAIKALNDAAKSGDSSKVAEALKDLDPAAQAVAKTISGITQGPLKDLERMVQGRMFAGFDRDLQGLSDKAFPRLKGNIGGIADAWNGTLKQVTGSLGNERNLSLFDRFLGNTADGQKRASAAIEPFTHAFATLLSTGGEFLPRLGDALAKVANRFDDFIGKAGKSGQLWKWIDEGLNGLRALGNSLLNIGKTIAGLTHAESGDGGFLGWLEKATGKMSAFVNSAAGQSKLHDFFSMGKENMHEWADLFKELGPLLLKIVEGFALWGQVTLPIVTALAAIVNWLGQIPGLIQGMVVALLAFKTASGVLGLVNKLPGVGGAAGAAGGAAGGAVGGGIFGGSRLNKGIFGVAGLLGSNAIQQSSQQSNSAIGQIGGALGTVGSGALIGSAILPGVGTAVGAGVGGAIAAVTYLMGEDAKAAKIAADAHAALADQMQRGTVAAEQMRDAQISINNALTNSGGKIDSSIVGDVGQQIKNIPDSLSGMDPKIVEEVRNNIKGLGVDQQQLATIVANGGPVLQAQLQTLRRMGPTGEIAARALQQISDATRQGADAAIAADPALRSLAEAFTGGDLAQAKANIQQLFNAIPSGDALNASMAGVTGPGGLLDMLNKLGGGATVGQGGVIHLANGIDPEILHTLERITGKIIDINQQGELRIQTNAAQTQLALLDQQLNGFATQWRNIVITPQIHPQVDLPLPTGPNIQTAPGSGGYPGIQIPHGSMGGIMRWGYPTGGVLPGYSPGVDNMMVPLSGGEGIVIPEAQRALGADWLYGVNSRFRPGLSRAGYAGGGVVSGFDDGGVVGNDTSTIGLLTQIRDLLAGKGANATTAPLNTIASATKTAKVGGGTTGLAAFSPGAGFVNGVMEWFFGKGSPLIPGGTGVGGGGLGSPGVGGMPGASVDFGRYAAALAAFAHSGNLADVGGLGLGVNSPVITALTSARNKNKGGLSDDQIAELVQQVIGGGSFGGTLDQTNTPLIKSLQRYRDQIDKTGMATMPGMIAAPVSGGPAGSKAGLKPNAENLWNVIASQFPQVKTIGGVRADPIPDHPTGHALDIMVGQDQALGDQINAYIRANAAALGIDSTIWRDKWADFAGNSSTVSGHQDHIHAKVNDAALSGGGLMMPAGLSGMPGLGGSSALGSGGGSPVPVYVTNWGGGAPGGGEGGLPPGLAPIAQAGLSAAGQVATDVGGSVLSAGAASFPEALFGEMGTPTRPNAQFAALVHQRNPLALAQLAGLNVPDYTRAGSQIGATQGIGSAYDASGRLYSDTGALVNRTFTDLGAQINAMRSQTVGVMKQVDTKLSDQVLQPVLSAGVTSGVQAVNTSVFAAQGAAMGQTAGPIIASAVASAIPTGGTGSSGGLDPNATGAASSVTNGLGGVLSGIGGGLMMADGGLVSGGTPGVDSVPILAQQNEWMLNTDDVARLGGAPGVARFVGGLRSGKLRMLASGGNIGSGPRNSSTVGSDFLGVTDIPFIGAIINLLINVLLKVIGVNLEMRNTLLNMSTDFRSFRGDAFKAFDAQGRLFSDTSGLVDRSSTSADTAAQERINILEKVIAGLIQFIIDKVIVPLMKAVAQSAIQALGSAVGAGITGATGGTGGAAGGAASSFISSLGNASVDIGAQIGQSIADALVQELVPLIGSSLQELLPGLMTSIFSGLLPALVLGPIGGILTTLFGGIIGVLTAMFGGVFGGASTLIPGLPFDNGGMAQGLGLLPKATPLDELVLSPGETDIFSRFVSALERGGFSNGGGNRSIHAPITVIQASPETPQQIQNRLLAHMP